MNPFTRPHSRRMPSSATALQLPSVRFRTRPLSSLIFIFVLTLGLLFLPQPSQGSSGFEVARGTLLDTAVTNQWTSFSFVTTFASTPLVFAIPTEQGDDPCAIRITNITLSGFQASCLEPASADGTHSAMEFHYLAIEPGLYELPLVGGSSLLVEAGFLDTTTVQHRCMGGCGATGWESVAFNSQLTSSLSVAPTVLTQVQELANETNDGASPSSPFLTSVVDTGSTTTSGFNVALERSEAATGSITMDERIGWFAMPSGSTCHSFDLGGGATVQFEAAVTPTAFDGWDNGCGNSTSFSCSFGAEPIVIGSKSSRRGNNGGWVRRCALSATEVFFTIDEDQERDNERNHIDEAVSLVAFASPISTTLASYTLLSDLAWYQRDGTQHDGTQHDGGLSVTWATSGETRAASYHLLAEGSDDGLTSLHSQPIPARLSSPQGAFYRVDLDPEAWQPGAGLWVQETSIDGKSQLHGPFYPERAPGPAVDGKSDRPWMPGQSISWSKDPEPRVKVADTPSPLLPPADSPSTGLAMDIHSTGLHGVSWQRLADAFGISQERIQTLAEGGLLELSLDGRPVAWSADPSNQRLVFFGVQNEDPLRAAATYRLVHSRPGLQIATDRVPPSPGASAATFEDRSVHEENLFPVTALPIDPQSDLWMWRGFHSGLPSHAVALFPFDLDSPVERSDSAARLSIVLQGASTASEPLIHRVHAQLNGFDLGEGRFFDLERSTLDFEFPAAWLQESNNELRVEALGSPTDGAASLFFLDRFQVIYPRPLTSGQNPFFFQPVLGVGVEVGGFPTHPRTASNLLLFSLEDPNRPRQLVGFGEIERNERRYIHFQTLSSADHLLVTDAALLEPQDLRSISSTALRQHRGATHLVIAPSAWSATANDLSQRRRAQGLDSATISIESIYDEFSSSHRDPRALARFLRHADAQWTIPPRYVVLLGDGHLDYRGHSDPRPNLIPPQLVITSEGLYASDHASADANSDGLPDIAIGRVPATSEEEVRAWLEKMIVWEDSAGASWRSSALFLADVPDSAGNFVGVASRLSEELAQPFPVQGWQSEVQSIGEGGWTRTRETLLEALGGDVGLLTWVGHGGLDRWSRDGLLTQADVGNLAGDQRAPMVLVLGCNTNRFELPGFSSLGGDLTLHPDGGAVAVFAPSGATRLSQTFEVGRRWIEELGTPDRGRLGDRLLRPIYQVSVDPGWVLSAETVQSYVLFGDPAMLID